MNVTVWNTAQFTWALNYSDCFSMQRREEATVLYSIFHKALQIMPNVILFLRYDNPATLVAYKKIFYQLE